MYTAKVRSKFSSAHNLRGYKGKCEELHGHNWNIEVSVKADSLDGIGMVIDFTELKSALNGILSDLDHKYLNEIEYFKQANPTSENLACYIFKKLKDIKPELDMHEVTVWETDTSSATYSEGGQEKVGS